MLKLTEASKSSEEAQAKTTPDYEQVSAHLSNERTFLAWTCTGILLMGFGVAVAKMRIALTDFSQSVGSALQSSGNREISPILMGMSFLVLGLLTILIAACRYLTVQTQIQERKYHPSNLHIYLFLIALTFLGGTLILHVMQLRQAGP